MSKTKNPDALRNKRFHGSKRRDSEDKRNEFQRDYGRLIHSSNYFIRVT